MRQVVCPTCKGKGFEMVWTAQEVMVLGILFEVADKHGVSVEAIRGRGKQKVVVQARFEAMQRLRNAGLMLKEVGRETGGRHHSTVIHALKKVV